MSDSSRRRRRRTPSTKTWTSIVRPIQRLLVVCLPCVVVCFLVARVTASESDLCTDEDTGEPLPFLQTVLLSDVVVYGMVIKTYGDTRYRKDVYTAEMEVYCIIKGRRTARIINITEAGFLPGKCFSTDLSPGSTYVLLAEFDGSKYRPVESEKPGNEGILKEVASTCNIDPKYPFGVTERADNVRCPTPSPPGECIGINHFTTTITTTEPTPTDDDYEYPPDGPVIAETDPSDTDYRQHSSSSKSSVLFVRLLPLLVLLATLHKMLGAACLGY